MNSSLYGPAHGRDEGRHALRQALRARRAALPADERTAAARTITAHVAGTRWLQHARSLALYVSVGAEVSTAPLRRLAHARGYPVYLPRIVDYRHKRMLFAPDRGESPALNRYGIPEPAGRGFVPVRALAVVFLPVLGFDRHGTRLGSGAGYYDRLLSFRLQRSSWHSPMLVGLAYGCQELPHIERRTHDVALDAVVTEDGMMFCTPQWRPAP